MKKQKHFQFSFNHILLIFLIVYTALYALTFLWGILQTFRDMWDFTDNGYLISNQGKIAFDFSKASFQNYAEVLNFRGLFHCL